MNDEKYITAKKWWSIYAKDLRKQLAEAEDKVIRLRDTLALAERESGNKRRQTK